MEKIIEIFTGWLLRLGLTESVSSLLVRIGVIMTMLLVAFIIDRVCRKVIIPTMRKITAKTEFIWDDYLLGENILNDLCRFISPIVSLMRMNLQTSFLESV